ncbi:MAG: DMT family transporter [Ignavibacteria bacterium]
MSAVIFWGTSFIATKFALKELSPVTIIMMRLVFASLLLLLIALITRRDFKITIKNHLRILLLALVAVFHLWIQVTGLKYTSASNTGWIIGTAPIFITILAVAFLKEKIALLQVAGIFLAMFGVLFLVGKGDLLNIDLIKNKGDLLVLSSAFTWGVYSIINKKISLAYSPLMTILYLFIMMALVIIPFNLDANTINSIINLSLLGWICVLFLGLFCSGAAYVIWAYSLREMDSAKVGAFLYFEPFITVLAAWLILAESITVTMLISGLLITIGVILVNKE